MPKLPQVTRGTLLWIVAYVATMAVTVWLLWWARSSVLAALDDPAQRAQWQQWKQQEEIRMTEGTSPVERRPPVSEEPPSLVLMRDSFAAVVSTCLILGTVLFAFLALFVRGVISGRPPAPPNDAGDPLGHQPLFARRAGE
jgi:hypothetical protein